MPSREVINNPRRPGPPRPSMPDNGWRGTKSRPKSWRTAQSWLTFASKPLLLVIRTRSCKKFAGPASFIFEPPERRW